MAAPPNILLITSDQQHYDTLGATNPNIRTPALDRLCAEGTRFTRAYTCNPVCSPTRASIITGQYPSTHGCWTIGVKLPEDIPTVGDHLGAAGYTTGLIGKAHFQPLSTQPGSESLECQPTLRDLYFWKNFHGPWYGFDHVELARNHADESHCGQHYALWMEEKGLTNWRQYFRDWPHDSRASRREHSWELPEEYHYSCWTAERTMAFIDRCVDDGQPFFAWASFHDPHPPYLVPEPWASMYDPEDMVPGELVPGENDNKPPQYALTQQPKPDFSAWHEEYGSHGCHSHLIDRDRLKKNMAVYYGMISLMDREIGRILDHLDERGLADNTLVVFSTDHGHYLGHHGLIAKGPFHYDDGIKVPFIVRFPGRVPAGAVSDSFQSLVDLAPTFLQLAGLEVPGEMQGVSQWNTWCGGPPARDHVICENRHQPHVLNMRTFVNDRYKVTVYHNAPYGELYDLREDPGEVRNLWDDPSALEVKARLLQEFIQADMKREHTRMPRIAGA